MPLSAYGVLATFLGVAAAAGSAATWLVGPRRPRAVIVPIGASIVALGSLGHGARIGVGPTVSLFGYEVRFVFDAALAIVVALAAALVQRTIVRSRHGVEDRSTT